MILKKETYFDEDVRVQKMILFDLKLNFAIVEKKLDASQVSSPKV
jgi:hypothetical protein